MGPGGLVCVSVVHAVDLFAGAGGTSTGLALACKDLGREVELTAINHWQKAIDTHSANHPWAGSGELSVDIRNSSRCVRSVGGFACQQMGLTHSLQVNVPRLATPSGHEHEGHEGQDHRYSQDYPDCFPSGHRPSERAISYLRLPASSHHTRRGFRAVKLRETV